MAAALVVEVVAVRENDSAKNPLSQSWYRVEGLRPGLRRHVKVHRHVYRGRDWYVLQDESTGRFHRLSSDAYAIVGLMDGRRTLSDIWESACLVLGDDMPTQDEVINLVSSLHSSELLQSDASPDMESLYRRSRQQQRSQLLGNLRSPMAVRIRLFDPDGFLDRTKHLVAPLFGWAGAAVWCIVGLAALAVAGVHWEELTSDITDRVLSMENLAILWFVYPAVKVVHEFGHAYAVKRWGGEVHEMGIMLLVLVPVPYVDASSSSAFRDKRRRMAVGAAGIMVESFLAAAALLVWVSVEPGLARAVMYNVIIIGGVSTLLMNGNPLLRFDAYYILSDLLEIPNLGKRSNGYIVYLVKRYVLGIKAAESTAHAPGEEFWLGAYAVASFFYRIVVMVGIILFVAGKFFVVGVVLACWTAASMVLLPAYKAVRHAFEDRNMRQNMARTAAAAAAAVAVSLSFLFFLPLPSFTVAEGVVWAPDESLLYAGVDGFVEEVIAKPGAQVHKGDPLVLLRSAELDTDVRVYAARLGEIQARKRLSEVKDRTETKILDDELNRVRAELSRARDKSGELVLKSPADGTFILPEADDLPGRYVRQGSPLGYVVDFGKTTARVVVGQDDIDLVRSSTRSVEARLSGDISRVVPASVVRESPSASRELPSMALSLQGGGSIALDPKETEVPKTFERYFNFEVALSDTSIGRVGERVYVRFEHEPEPLAFRVYRVVRRMLLRRVDV